MSLILANQVLIECSKNSHVFDKASLDIEFTLKITSQVSELQQKLSIVRHMLFLGVLTGRYQDIYNLIGINLFFEADVNLECMQTSLSSRNKCPNLIS